MQRFAGVIKAVTKPVTKGSSHGIGFMLEGEDVWFNIWDFKEVRLTKGDKIQGTYEMKENDYRLVENYEVAKRDGENFGRGSLEKFIEPEQPEVQEPKREVMGFVKNRVQIMSDVYHEMSLQDWWQKETPDNKAKFVISVFIQATK